MNLNQRRPHIHTLHRLPLGGKRHRNGIHIHNSHAIIARHGIDLCIGRNLMTRLHPSMHRTRIPLRTAPCSRLARNQRKLERKLRRARDLRRSGRTGSWDGGVASGCVALRAHDAW